MGGGPLAETGYSGTETGDAQVLGGSCAGAGEGEMAVLGASVWDD